MWAGLMSKRGYGAFFASDFLVRYALEYDKKQEKESYIRNGNETPREAPPFDATSSRASFLWHTASFLVVCLSVAWSQVEQAGPCSSPPCASFRMDSCLETPGIVAFLATKAAREVLLVSILNVRAIDWRKNRTFEKSHQWVSGNDSRRQVRKK
jgi:hypothetical protein